MSRAQKHLRRGKFLVVTALTAAVALALVQPARSAEPLERVRTTLEAVTMVLRDPAMQSPDQERERQQQVRTIIYDAFNFQAMAKEALGSQWGKLLPAQQDEFISLFGSLFERSYNRLMVRYLGERQTIYGGESLEKTRALVYTTLVSKNESKLPVDYQLVSHDQRWAIYDVIIDGVSLATNYRAQFTKILRTSSVEALLQRIKEKIEKERL